MKISILLFGLFGLAWQLGFSSVSFASDPLDDIVCSPDAEIKVSVRLGNKSFEIPGDKKIQDQRKSGWNDGVLHRWGFWISAGGKTELLSIKHDEGKPHCEVMGYEYVGDRVPVAANWDLEKLSFFCSRNKSDLHEFRDQIPRLTCTGTPGKPFGLRDLREILGSNAKITMTPEAIQNYRKSIAEASRKAGEEKRIADTKASIAHGDAKIKALLAANCKVVVSQVLAAEHFSEKMAEIERIQKYFDPLTREALKSAQATLADKSAKLKALLEKTKAVETRQDAWNQIHELADPALEHQAQSLNENHGSTGALYGANGKEAKDSDSLWHFSVDTDDDGHGQIGGCRQVSTSALEEGSICMSIPLFATGGKNDPETRIHVPSLTDEGATLPLDRGAFAGQFFSKVIGSNEEATQARELCPLVLSAADYAPFAAEGTTDAAQKKAIGKSPAQGADSRASFTVLPGK
ncbi:MAG: hypothetical protein ACXVCH_13985 [Bdellovibrionota bacterium]